MTTAIQDKCDLGDGTHCYNTRPGFFFLSETYDECGPYSTAPYARNALDEYARFLSEGPEGLAYLGPRLDGRRSTPAFGRVP